MQLVFRFQKAEYFVAVCFSSPAGHKRANEPVNPFTGWHLQGKWGVTGRIPGRNAPIMGKGMFQMHFIGISLGYNKSFPFIVSITKKKLSAYVGFYGCYAKNTLLLSMPA